MSQDVLDKVFEPFFTTKEVAGFGLGLSMVYGFVKQSGGHIRIYSEIGHGTTIKLYLRRPAARSRPAGRGGAAAPWRRNHHGGGRRRAGAQLRHHAIAEPRYRTVGAANGPAALNLIEGGQPFDLLFTDVIMPGGLSGRELAEKALKLRPGIKVLYTSGYTDNAIVHQGRLDPGVLLLTKPYRKSQLANMIRRALTG